MFSHDELIEIFCHKTAGMELTTFSPRTRDPPPSSFQMCIKYFGSHDSRWEMFGSVMVLIWADVAPKACQILRRYVENEYRFTVEYTVGRSTDANQGLTRCTYRTKTGGWGSHLLTQATELSQEEITDVKKQSGLWAVPQSVLVSFDEYGPHLLILNRMEQPLLGLQPSIRVTEDTTGEQSGIVVGKVLSSSPELLETLRRKPFLKLVWFKCSIVQTNV